ncbi:MAG: ABC transporter permease [Caldilineales bacterium]|nr:ABC transporter permease [Caldilineales bacterium]
MSLLVARERPLTSPLVYTLIVLGGALLALLLGAVLMALWGVSPLQGYRELFMGMFGSAHSISESLLKATPLIIISLGIAIAFSASAWNIGAEGQFYMGALAATACALVFSQAPGYLLWPLTLIVAMVVGGIWAALAGYLRARYGINEIIVTVMLNYIAMYFVQYMLASPLRETQARGVGYPQTDVIPQTIWLPRLAPGLRLHVGFLLAVALVFVVYMLLRHTTLGYRLRAVGYNWRAARHAGIGVSNALIWAMGLSGALAGLAGQLEVTGVHRRLLWGISPGYGFLAIVVTLLGNRHPFGIFIAAILLAALDFGAQTMQRGTGVPVALVHTIQYLMVILVVGGGVLRTHRLTLFDPLFRRREA